MIIYIDWNVTVLAGIILFLHFITVHNTSWDQLVEISISKFSMLTIWKAIHLILKQIAPQDHCNGSLDDSDNSYVADA